MVPAESASWANRHRESCLPSDLPMCGMMKAFPGEMERYNALYEQVDELLDSFQAGQHP